MSHDFKTSDLLNCYRDGVFPMGNSRHDERIFLVEPEYRGILPLDQFHVPRRLAKKVRSDPFRITINSAFNRVIEACSEPNENRPKTWINERIQNLYAALHHEGHAHSVECWNEDGQLVGGLYGVSVGAAFFGESMFSRLPDASKIALIHLVARLIHGGYELLDAQFHNPHLEQFGLIEIERDQFQTLLRTSLQKSGDFYSLRMAGVSGKTATQLITQTS
ncbi:MAG: Leucyl/phenylalanyl-tRNA--protein transferase [Hyphomonas sp. TMED17]|nr:MAG: Leucyl/phenylalanyl-tRNA--protein transferase [Hyphomonas sp. TMED17]